MEKIASFQVNHLVLQRGIYVSRRDGDITTFDIRMKAPNREPVMDVAAVHTLEHLGATYLRNEEKWKDRIVYWGPMGCLTGFYLIIQGKENAGTDKEHAIESADIVRLMQDTYRWMADFEGEIPGATPRDCGNYSMQNLPLAKQEASRYLNEVLLSKDLPLRY